MEAKSWFEVDKDGLRQLQAGKPKHYLMRELIQNAWDEEVKKVNIELELDNEIAKISVEDDSKEGFKDLRDSYTLYKDTYKRKDPEKRGRFNLGEKQAFSICEKAIVETTKGSIIFDEQGRREIPMKRRRGSKITVWVKMNKEEFEEIREMIDKYIVPKNIKFYVNGKRRTYLKPDKVFEARLTTELSDGQAMRRTMRKTKVELYKNEINYLYEMGIPVTKIDCEWSINICQKIPLGVDRETISQNYLRDVFSEVLNNTFDTIDEEHSSQGWIREAMRDERISEKAFNTIIEKRYGSKVCVADPFDANSIDEAISNGFRVIRGSELSKEEWNNARRFNSLDSSRKLFGSNFTYAKQVEPNKQQKLVAKYAIKIAKRLLNIDIDVNFVKERDMVAAQYGNNTLTLNIAKLGKKFFEIPVSAATTDLILHELGHHAGNHTEMEYHNLITKMGGQLVILALNEPEFFNLQ